MSDESLTTAASLVASAVVSPEPTTEADLPEWARTKLTEANNEAAKYRIEKRDAVEAAREAVTNQFTAAITEKDTAYVALQGDLGDAWVDLQKLHSAIDAGVPSDKLLGFVSVLKGSNADEINASAKSAKELFGGFATSAPATDPTQGSSSKHLPLNGDPILQALSNMVGA